MLYWSWSMLWLNIERKWRNYCVWGFWQKILQKESTLENSMRKAWFQLSNVNIIVLIISHIFLLPTIIYNTHNTHNEGNIMLLYPMSNIIVRVQRNCFMYSSNIFYCITCITLSNVAVWTSSTSTLTCTCTWTLVKEQWREQLKK